MKGSTQINIIIGIWITVAVVLLAYGVYFYPNNVIEKAQ
jgi:hypothetical protein